MWFSFFFSPWVVREHSEPIQTAFRASHGKAHGLGNLNCVVLCEEIILLCSLILPLASFIRCPLAQGSTESFLFYLFHSSHYFINHYKSFLQPFAFQAEECWSNCFLDNAWSQSLLWQLGDKGMKLLCAQATGTQRETEHFPSLFSPKEFSLSPEWSLFGVQHIHHHVRNENYHLTSEINLECTQSDSEGWVRNGQRSARIFHVNCTWTCSFQNHFSCSLCQLVFLICFFFFKSLKIIM